MSVLNLEKNAKPKIRSYKIKNHKITKIENRKIENRRIHFGGGQASSDIVCTVRDQISKIIDNQPFSAKR